MRIIAGEFRGRTLLPPPSQATRPVTDRVKQSVFDILTPLIPDAVVYDCFAGTGSMGLECLSRGAAQVTFFEADRGAAERLRRNIETLKVEDRSTVITSDLFRWFADRKSRGRATLAFLDPPYRFLREKPNALRALAADLTLRHLDAGATIIFRHDAADALDLPPLVRSDVREYGSMTVEFLRAETTAAAPRTVDP
ncbi:MAG TPA: 16S rRNA (guanine(966)-N(2))-methyltransferase RsmD [Tepidisphaeraceae bacterium]